MPSGTVVALPTSAEEVGAASSGCAWIAAPWPFLFGLFFFVFLLVVVMVVVVVVVVVVGGGGGWWWWVVVVGGGGGWWWWVVVVVVVGGGGGGGGSLYFHRKTSMFAMFSPARFYLLYSLIVINLYVALIFCLC